MNASGERGKEDHTWESRRQASLPPCYPQSPNHGQAENLPTLFAFLSYAPHPRRNLCPSRHCTPVPSTSCLPPRRQHSLPTEPLLSAHVGRGLAEFITGTRGRAGTAPEATPAHLPNALAPQAKASCFLMTAKDFAKTKEQLYLKLLRPGWKQSLAHSALVFSSHYFSPYHPLFLLIK